MKPRLAPIELLHPTGALRGTAVVGDDIPDWLAPVPVSTGGPADVILVAANADSAERLARAAVERLSDGGVVVAFGPRSARRRLEGELAQLGVAHPANMVAHRSRRRPGGSLALDVRVGTASRLGSAAAVLGAALDVREETVYGTVLRRDPGARVAGWLPGDGSIRIRTSWRGEDGAAIVSRAGPGGAAGVHAKIGLDEGSADVGAREVAALNALAASATSAGARVPVVRGMPDVAGRPAAVLSTLDGQVVARASRGTLRRSADEALRWVQRFAHGTRSTTAAGPLLETTFLRPAHEALRGVDRAAAYVHTLERMAAEVSDVTIPVTAAHGDLTLWNVLTGGDGAVGVLDWEGARGAAPPLVDLPYAMVDVRAAAGRYRDRLGAFLSCFPDARPSATWATAAAQLDVPPHVATIAFHACWLGHAADERRRGIDGPFRAIVGTLARRGVA